MRADPRRGLCSYVQNTRIRVLPESIVRSRDLRVLYVPAGLRAKSRAIPDPDWAALGSSGQYVCASVRACVCVCLCVSVYTLT